MTTKAHLACSVIMSAAVLATVVWGVAVVGTPGATRLQRLDQRRLEDLRTIFREVQSLCHDPELDLEAGLKRPLPGTLDELASMARSERIRLTDPETGQGYLYSVKGETTYELCATFARSRDSDVEVFWNHPAGTHCFTIDALDPP